MNVNRVPIDPAPLSKTRLDNSPKGYCSLKNAPRCQSLAKDFGTEVYRIARHLYDPYLSSHSYGNHGPLEKRHNRNGTLKWIYLRKRRSQQVL